MLHIIIKNNDQAVWRRIKLIPFNVTINDDKQDKHLLEKLINELPGILNWALEGCLVWQECGLEYPIEVLQATKEYKSEEDVIGQFISENCNVLAGNSIKLMAMHKHYREWCEYNDIVPIGKTLFSRALSSKGILKQRSTNNAVYLRGIEIKEELIKTADYSY